MKVLILPDSHYGCRSDNPCFYDYQKKFMDNIILPLIEEVKPSYIIHLGDIVDNRRSLNYNTMNRLKKDFIQPLQSKKIPIFWIVGNHDIFYKNTLMLNAQKQLIEVDYYNEIIDKPLEIGSGNNRFLLVPWICEENKENCLNKIGNSNAQFCFGHFAINGFEQRKGTFEKHGFSKEIFNRYESVVSGHFHTRSHSNNIHYVGACYQFDWSDYGQYRGVAILDTETNKIEYIENPYPMFNIIEYDEKKPEKNISFIENTYCRLIVKEKKSETKLKDYIDLINSHNPIDLGVMDYSLEKKDFSNTNIIVDEVKSTCDNYLAGEDIPHKELTQDIFEKLYQRSI